jgi:carboxylesterase type B
MGQFTGDWFFVANSRATADAWSRAGRPAWLYHSIAAFPEGTPGAQMGAFHGYAFDNGALNSVEWDPEGVFDQLTKRMSLRLAAFARSGDPNVEGLPRWELYDREGDAYLLLDHEEDTPSRGLRPEDLDPLQKAIQERGH